MGDISASSAEWRRLVVKDAQEYYERYQTADQYSRLSMKPTPSLELGDTRWARVDRRGASILLGAVPEDVKKELIASRSKRHFGCVGSSDGVVPTWECAGKGTTSEEDRESRASHDDPRSGGRPETVAQTTSGLGT